MSYTYFVFRTGIYVHHAEATPRRNFPTRRKIFDRRLAFQLGVSRTEAERQTENERCLLEMIMTHITMMTHMIRGKLISLIFGLNAQGKGWKPERDTSRRSMEESLNPFKACHFPEVSVVMHFIVASGSFCSSTI